MARWKSLILSCGVLASCEAPTGGLPTLSEPNIDPYPPPPGACTGPWALSWVRHGGASLPWAGIAPAALGADGLYQTDFNSDNAALTVWSRTGEVRALTEASPLRRYQLLGGSGGSVMWAETDQGAEQSTVYLLNEAGVTRALGRTDAPVVDPGQDGPLRQVIEQGRGAYYTQSTIEVASSTEPTPYANLLSLRPNEAPYLRWPYLALTGFASNEVVATIRVYDLERGWAEVLSVTGDVHNAILYEDALVYLDGTKPFRVPLDGSAPAEALGDRECSSIDTDGARLVLACDPSGPAFWPPWLTTNRSLWIYEGGQLRPVELAGRTATLPRIRGALLAYFAYGDVDFCGRAGEGTVVLHDLQSHRDTELSQVGVGCYCCDAYWPPPRLLLEQDLVAWNYDQDDVGWGWGMASLTQTCPEASN